MLPTYVTKSLIAASSTGIGTVSSAATPVITVNTSALDTPRRIAVTSTAPDISATTFTLTGTRQGGGVITEAIKGSTGTNAVATSQDFAAVTKISASNVPASLAIFGTNTQGGTAWQQTNTHTTPYNLGFALTFSSTANSMAGSLEFTLDDPTLVSSGPSGVPGGQVAPLNAPPAVFVSTACSTATGPTAGLHLIPSWGWRVTLTSSSSSAGSINFTAIQAGIG